MRKIAIPNLTDLDREINHPVYAERLPHVILPKDLAQLDKKRVKDLIADNFIVVAKEKESQKIQKFTPLGLLTEISRGWGQYEILGEDFSGLEIDASPDKQKQQVADFKARLNQRGISNIEFELLLFHNQRTEYLSNDIIVDGYDEDLVPKFSYENQYARYFRGEDGYIYQETILYNPSINIKKTTTDSARVEKKVPGQLKAVYRLTTAGPELAYMAASNTALKRLLLEKNVEVNDALIKQAVEEEKGQSSQHSQSNEKVNPLSGEVAVYLLPVEEEFISRICSDHNEEWDTRCIDAGKELARARWGFPDIDKPKFPEGINSSETLLSGTGEEKENLLKQFVGDYIDQFIKTLPSQYRNKYGDDAIKKWIISNSAESIFATAPMFVGSQIQLPDRPGPKELEYNLTRISEVGHEEFITIHFDKEKQQLCSQIYLSYGFQNLRDGPTSDFTLHYSHRIDARDKENALHEVHSAILSHNVPLETSRQVGLPHAISGKGSLIAEMYVPLRPVNLKALREQETVERIKEKDFAAYKQVAETFLEGYKKKYPSSDVVVGSGNMPITIAPDSKKQNIVFRTAKPYEFAETAALVQSAIDRTLDSMAERSVGEIPAPSTLGTKVIAELNRPTTNLKENTIYAYPNTEEVWFAFYVSPEGKAYEPVAIDEMSDLNALFPNADSSVRNPKTLEVINFAPITQQYRREQWHASALEKRVEERRRAAIDTVLKKLEPLMGRSAHRHSTFGIYTVNEISEFKDDLGSSHTKVLLARNFITTLNNQKKEVLITDEQWSKFVDKLNDIRVSLVVLRNQLPVPISSSKERVEAAVDAVSVEVLKFLKEEAQNTPRGRMNEEAVRNAWRVDLTEYERNQVPDMWADIESRCLADDRIPLLFLKKTYVTDATYKQWDNDYAPLDGVYTGLDNIDYLLQDYRAKALTLNTATRVRDVGLLLKQVKNELDNHNLPEYLRVGRNSALSRLDNELMNEMSHLREVAQIRKDVAMPEAEFLAPRPKSVEVKHDDNIEMQRKIFKAFKEAKKPLPNRRELADYAKLVTNTKKTLEDAEKDIAIYLASVHGLKVGDVLGFLNLPDVRDPKTGLSSKEKLSDNLKSHPKVSSCVIMLGIIERFRQRHGKDFDTASLTDIEDYEAGVATFEASLKRNNDMTSWFQGNRLADGDVSYNTPNAPGGKFTSKGLTKVLSSKPRSIFRKKATFTLEFGQALAAFESAEYQIQQRFRSWITRDSSGKRKQSVLTETATSATALWSSFKKYSDSVQTAYFKAESLDELDELYNQVSITIEEKATVPGRPKNFLTLLERNGRSKKEKEGLHEIKPLDSNARKAANEERQRVNDIFAEQPHMAKDTRDFLEFMYRLAGVRLETSAACQEAKSNAALEKVKFQGEYQINRVWREFVNGKIVKFVDGEIIKGEIIDPHPRFDEISELKATCQANINAVKDGEHRTYKKKLKQFRQAKLEYWDNVMKSMAPTLAAIDQSVDAQEIRQLYVRGENLVKQVPMPEGLATDDGEKVQIQAQLMLANAQTQQLKVLLTKEVDQIVKKTIEEIEKRVSIQELGDLEVLHQGAAFGIDALVMRMAFLPADVSKEVVEPQLERLAMAVKAQKQSIKLRPQQTIMTAPLTTGGVGIEDLYSSVYQPELMGCPIENLPGFLSYAIERVEKKYAKVKEPGLLEEKDQYIAKLVESSLDRVQKYWSEEIEKTAEAETEEALAGVYKHASENIAAFELPKAHEAAKASVAKALLELHENHVIEAVVQKMLREIKETVTEIPELPKQPTEDERERWKQAHQKRIDSAKFSITSSALQEKIATAAKSLHGSLNVEAAHLFGLRSQKAVLMAMIRDPQFLAPIVESVDPTPEYPKGEITGPLRKLIASAIAPTRLSVPEKFVDGLSAWQALLPKIAGVLKQFPEAHLTIEKLCNEENVWPESIKVSEPEKKAFIALMSNLHGLKEAVHKAADDKKQKIVGAFAEKVQGVLEKNGLDKDTPVRKAMINATAKTLTQDIYKKAEQGFERDFYDPGKEKKIFLPTYAKSKDELALIKAHLKSSPSVKYEALLKKQLAISEKWEAIQTIPDFKEYVHNRRVKFLDPVGHPDAVDLEEGVVKEFTRHLFYSIFLTHRVVQGHFYNRRIIEPSKEWARARADASKKIDILKSDVEQFDVLKSDVEQFLDNKGFSVANIGQVLHDELAAWAVQKVDERALQIFVEENEEDLLKKDDIESELTQKITGYFQGIPESEKAREILAKDFTHRLKASHKHKKGQPQSAIKKPTSVVGRKTKSFTLKPPPTDLPPSAPSVSTLSVSSEGSSSDDELEQGKSSVAVPLPLSRNPQSILVGGSASQAVPTKKVRFANEEKKDYERVTFVN